MDKVHYLIIVYAMLHWQLSWITSCMEKSNGWSMCVLYITYPLLLLVMHGKSTGWSFPVLFHLPSAPPGYA